MNFPPFGMSGLTAWKRTRMPLTCCLAHGRGIASLSELDQACSALASLARPRLAQTRDGATHVDLEMLVEYTNVELFEGRK